MKNKLTHFAIHIDDIDRAQKFYDGVFDWGFNSYGQDVGWISKFSDTEGNLFCAMEYDNNAR